MYVYTGDLGPDGIVLDLGNQDYATSLLWLLWDTPENIVPAGLNVSPSDAIGVGGLVVRNDVRGGVEAYIDDAIVSAADVGVQATERATILALAESVASASGGSAYGTGVVIAGNGAAATNLVLSGASAYIVDSDVTVTAGNVNVQAANTSIIDATLLGSASSSDTAIGVVLAFNTVGWEAQSLLLSALDALIGRPLEDFDYAIEQTLQDGLDYGARVKDGDGKVYRYIGSAIEGVVELAGESYIDVTRWLEVVSPYGQEDPAVVEAYIFDSLVDAAGEVTVSANGEAQINATVSNAASSTASALYGATGASIGGIIASNRVSSTAKAYIDYSIDFVHPAVDVHAGGAVSVEAADNAGVYANSKMVASSITTNDGGASLLADAFGDVVGAAARYRSDEGTMYIRFGERVRLADDFDRADFTSDTGLTAIDPGAKVLLAEDYADPTFTSEDGVRLLRNGDTVQLAGDYQQAFGTPGGLYRFVGTGGRGERIDLSAENYTDTSLWRPVGGTGG